MAKRATLKISNRSAKPELPSMRIKLPLSVVRTVKIPAMSNSENIGIEASHLSPSSMRINGRAVSANANNAGNVMNAVSFIDLR